MLYDVIIIGAGPAGISASLYTKRGNLKTLILYEEESSLEKTNKIENYYGFEKGVSGKELYQSGIKQAENLGIEVKKEEVIKIEIVEDGFIIKTINTEYQTKVVIFATGNKKTKPKIMGIENFEGKGISYCAVCDGFFYRNKSVAVLGNGDYAISEINDLIPIVKDITILTDGKKEPEFRANNVKVDTRKIKEIQGENKVEKVQFWDGTKIEIDGIFVAEGIAGSIDFAKKLGVFTNKDRIIINEKMETNIKGLYACGDCTGGLLQITKAVYEGTIAGLQAIQYFKMGGK